MGVTTRGATAPVKPSEVRPLERFTIRSVAGLLAVVGAGTGFGLLLLLVRLSWHPLERVDRGAADSLNRLAAGNSALVAVLKGISQLGGGAVLWWLVIVGAIGLLLRRQALLAAYIVVTGLGAHYVSDVVAGWLLGVAWLGVTAYAFRVLHKELFNTVPPPTEGLAPEAAPALV